MRLKEGFLAGKWYKQRHRGENVHENESCERKLLSGNWREKDWN